MRCGRGLRATHYIVLPRLTNLGLVTDTVAGANAEETAGAIRVVIPSTNSPIDFTKICSFSLFAKPVLINFKKLYQNGYSIFKFSHFL